MDAATALWILVPLVMVHVALARRRSALLFQVCIDIVLLALPIRHLAAGAHLGAGIPGAAAWGAPAHLAGSPEQTDLPLEAAAWLEEVRRLVRDGQPPWVSDRIGGGVPLFANGQTAAPFPLQLPIWALGAARGTDVATVWRLEAAALGAFLLLARLRVHTAAAAAGGFAFGLNLYLVSWATVALAWIVAALPWAWRALVGTLRGRRRDAALLAVLLGVLGGWCVNPGTALFLWLGIGTGGVALAWGRVRRVRRLAVVVVLAVAVAAVGAVPTLGYIAGSARIETTGGKARYPLEVVDWTLRGRAAALALVPWREGHPADGTWRLPLPSAAIELSAGTAAVALALLARPRRRHRRHALAAGTVLAVAACLFWQLPGAAHLLALVPPLAAATWPRVAFLVPFAVAVLAALALDAWLRRPRRARAAAVTVAAQIAVAVLAATAAPGAASHLVPALLAPAALAASLAASASAGALAVPAVVLAEQLASAWRVLPASSNVDRERPPHLVASLQRQVGAHGGRILGVGPALPPNLASGWGMADLRSHDPMRPRQLASLHAAFGARGLELPEPVTTPWAGLAGAWGVRWLVTPPGGDLSRRGWELVEATPDGEIYRNPRALPVTRLAGRVVQPPGEAAAGAWEDLDFASVAVVEEALAVGGGGTIAVTRELPHRVEAQVHAEGAVLAVLHVPVAPGWRGFLDGREAAVHVADIAAMGVLVPAGAHEVRWEYAPTGWRWGLAVTLLGLAASAALASGRWVTRW